MAKTKLAAAVYEKCRSATKNGTRAGTTPWQKSIKKCPSDKSPIASLFISRSSRSSIPAHATESSGLCHHVQ